jgi:putative DNA primase/helicase
LPFDLNDSGNANRIIRLYGEDLRYCHDWKKWLIWDKQRWVPDKIEYARQLAKRTMAQFFKEGVESGDARSNRLHVQA